VSKRRGVVLDRDGTLIDFHRDEELGAVVSAFHPNQLRILPGVVDGLRKLADAGFVLAIATNQPGPAKGQVSRAAIELTNEALVALLAEQGVRIAEVAVCWHHPAVTPAGDPALQRVCDCRKPMPGLLLSLASSLDLDPGSSWMIGDALVDVAAGTAAGFRTALLLDEHRVAVREVEKLHGAMDLLGPTIAALAGYIVAGVTRS
jgi:D-glycero-D-manno-heptose 1,7-bisphosphate phosphatase